MGVLLELDETMGHAMDPTMDNHDMFHGAIHGKYVPHGMDHGAVHGFRW